MIWGIVGPGDCLDCYCNSTDFLQSHPPANPKASKCRHLVWRWECELHVSAQNPSGGEKRCCSQSCTWEIDQTKEVSTPDKWWPKVFGKPDKGKLSVPMWLFQKLQIKPIARKMAPTSETDGEDDQIGEGQICSYLSLWKLICTTEYLTLWW